MKNTIQNTTMLTFNWCDYQYMVNTNVNDHNIKLALDSLYNDEFIHLNNNQLIMIQFKIKDTNNNIRSVSYLQTISLNNYNQLIEIFKAFWSLRTDYYHQLTVESIIFTYKIVNNSSEKIDTKIDSIRFNDKIETFKFEGINLPLTMDFNKWGDVLFNDNNEARVQKSNSKLTYEIKLFEDHQVIQIKFDNAIVLEFKDFLMNGANLSSFKRLFKNHIYIVEDGKIVLKQRNVKSKYLTKVNKNPFLIDKFITMDLETRTIDGTMEPYSISIFDGKEFVSFYLSDFNSADNMMKESITFLMKRKYHNYKVYLHNFSHFDGVFLLRILSELSKKIDTVIRDGRIIDLKLTYGSNDAYNVNFRDSYLMLPSSLSKLSENFQVENKTIFPYLFVNDLNVDLNYVGKIPSYEMFVKLTEFEYNKYCKAFEGKDWNLKQETIKYCEQDVKTLYQVIEKFNSNIFELFRLSIHKYPTLSSLAFGIYRSNYLKDNKIPLISGTIYDFIKNGYTGGAVDLYKSSGKNIFRYDVNSLYPYVMKEFPMPIGEPKYFEGDITKFQSDSFGFYKVEVSAPESLNIPILQTKIKIDNSIKSIAPLGTWTGVYFSEEIKNAMKFGYKFKILSGYTFEKGFIFKEYVDTLYNLKLNSERGSPNYIISKLLLNSLYGRLGMNPVMEQHKILASEDAFKIYQAVNIKVTSVQDFKNGNELVSYIVNNSNNDNTRSLNISIPVASAVTSYARIHMSKFKDLLTESLYYSDTDSIDTDIMLDSKYVGTGLGEMKLEGVFKEAVYIAPKVYGGILEDGTELTKVKGFKNIVTFGELYKLLNKDNSLELNQDKWMRDIANGNIKIQTETYNLKVTENKRELVYKDNKFISTKPFNLTNGVINHK